MSNTRRTFLQSAALTAGLVGAASPLVAQAPGGQSPAASVPDSEIKVPKVKFGKVEISRLVVGTNQFYGFSHHNQILDAVMREWYTAAKVVEVVQQCEKYGINASNYAHLGRAQADWARYRTEGGRMQPDFGDGTPSSMPGTVEGSP